MRAITLVSRFIVIIAALFFIAVAFNLVSSTSSASTCIPYKNGNGSHLHYKGHTYSYGHVGKVASTDIIMSGVCPIDGIPVTANQTQKSTPTVTTQQGKDIDKDKTEDSKEHGKKQTHHKIATENTSVTVNQTVNNNTYNTYQTTQQNNSASQQVNTSDLQINTQYPVGLYELQRFSLNGYCLGGHCYVLDHCNVIMIEVNQDTLYCLN